MILSQPLLCQLRPWAGCSHTFASGTKRYNNLVVCSISWAGKQARRATHWPRVHNLAGVSLTVSESEISAALSAKCFGKNLLAVEYRSGFPVADPEILKGWGTEDNVSASLWFIANARNKLYAFYTEKGGLLQKKFWANREWGRLHRLPLNPPLRIGIRQWRKHRSPVSRRHVTWHAHFAVAACSGFSSAFSVASSISFSSVLCPAAPWRHRFFFAQSCWSLFAAEARFFVFLSLLSEISV